MSSGCRFARAVYRAAVRPAGPEPMMMTLRGVIGMSVIDDVVIDNLIEIVEIITS